jgi:hypothetical protein
LLPLNRLQRSVPKLQLLCLASVWQNACAKVIEVNTSRRLGRLVPLVSLLFLFHLGIAQVPLGIAKGVDPDQGSRKIVKEPPAVQTPHGPAVQVPEGTDGFVEPMPHHPPGHPLGGWYLGVYGNYTSTGMLLTQVFPQTPAARVGLEVGDRIVTVSGRQIGDVNRSRLTIDRALQMYASPSGWVRLLVQDRRSGQLVNVDVRLVRGRIHT